MVELALAIDDPAVLLPEDVRRLAIAAAEEMLEHKGATAEQRAIIGTRPTKPVRLGNILSFFGGMREVAAATGSEVTGAVQATNATRNSTS